MSPEASHRLLRRQLKRCFGDAAATPAEMGDLLQAVDASCGQEGTDRSMLERSLEIVSQELVNRNRALQAQLTEREAAEQRLEHSLSLLRATLESTADGILVVGNDMSVETYNRVFLDMWGISEVEMRQWDGRARLAHFAAQVKDWESFLDGIERLLASSDEDFCQIELKDGRVLERHSKPRFLGGQCVGRVWSFKDVTERRMAERRLAHLANHDQLTQLPNRNLLLDRLEQAMQRAQRSGRLLAVLFVDLDRFKDVNDTLGHAAGDLILQQMARRLELQCRRSDMIARLGGDEYTIVLEDLQNADFACSVAQQLLDSCDEPFLIDGREVVCPISIGLAIYPADGATSDDLLKHADTAMYAAKEAGRGVYQRFSAEMDEQAMRRLLLVNNLRRALDRREFRLHYQPQMDLATGRVAGMEALLRWDHPELGLVNPSHFMAMLEETGIILPVGEWLLREACAFDAALVEHGLAPLRMSVNMSTKQFRQKQLFEQVVGILDDTGLPPELLEIEITESVLAEAHLDLSQLDRLRSRGIRFAIDDFGTGYSSLAYLKRFPLDCLKVDRSFVADVLVDADSAAITEAVIALGHSLKLRVIAEGVETPGQMEYLQRRGCDEVQGFVYAQPMSGPDLIQWLKQQAAGPDGGACKPRLVAA
ncbi:MAG TPA: EAL domain-containing protein [Chloroflexota bacterium]|nr:EAL domain-containing protein [Chloroflexota bacterium]